MKLSRLNRPFRSAGLCFLLMLGSMAAAVLGGGAHADEAQMAGTVAPQISEVTSGGSWTDGDKHGFYRAIIVVTGATEKTLSGKLYLQWLQVNGDQVPTIVSTVPIKEVNSQTLPNIAVDIYQDANNAGNTAVVVSSYNDDSEDATALYAIPTKPGNYSMVKDAPDWLGSDDNQE